jgi:hypothetical protein
MSVRPEPRLLSSGVGHSENSQELSLEWATTPGEEAA